MANHYIQLTAIPFAEDTVGNSMSTTASWDGRQKLTIRWKGERWAKTVGARPGDRVQIGISTTAYSDTEPVEIVVMRAPRHPVARAAWQRGFFRGKRKESLSALREEAKQEVAYDRERGCYMPAVLLYTHPAGTCAVAYIDRMEGWIGMPWRWWASPAATPAQMQELLAGAFDPDSPIQRTAERPHDPARVYHQV